MPLPLPESLSDVFNSYCTDMQLLIKQMYADLEAYAERPDANEFIISRRNEIIDIIVTFYNVALERIKELEFEKDLLLSLNSFSNFNRQLRDIEQKRHIIKAKYGSNTTEKNSQEKTVH